MALHYKSALGLWLASVLFSAAAPALQADESADLRRDMQALQKQNAALLEQLQKQQALIEGLTGKVADLQQQSAQRNHQNDIEAEAPAPKTGLNLGNVHISGQGGVAFFDTGNDGVFPNSEFRLHEASLFVEAPVWEDVYFFSELYLAQFESDDLDLWVGELYVDFENVSKLWGSDRLFNVRVGRLNVPFGEEYLYRDAIDNALITHSVVDFWGVDEGLELYGSAGKFSYVVAVQNGGTPVTRDFDSDKSVAARLAYDPTSWLHVSVSAMRTGDLNAENDSLSELWFGGGWFRSIGNSATTTTFHANLAQGDLALKFNRGHLRAFGGYACYDDDDTSADNQRGFYYYSVEGLGQVTKRLYAVARFSQIMVENGAYPLTGHGDMGTYFFNFNPAEFTTEIWRLSLGLGWRFSDHLVTKVEYSFERGRQANGNLRDNEDLFAVEAAFKF